jgi:hypothetical protein
MSGCARPGHCRRSWEREALCEEKEGEEGTSSLHLVCTHSLLPFRLLAAPDRLSDPQTRPESLRRPLRPTSVPPVFQASSSSPSARLSFPSLSRIGCFVVILRFIVGVGISQIEREQARTRGFEALAGRGRSGIIGEPWW